MAVYELDKNEIAFPDPRGGDEDGLIAIGGDLSIDRLLLAYNYGIFPWYSFRDAPEIMWFCPMKRFVIIPGEAHVSHSMKQLIRRGKYRVTLNKAFDEVIQGCSKAQNRIEQEGAWLGEDMIQAYTELYHQGFAASVEVWNGDKLVGGLYGVTLGRAFFGESMFSLEPSASKLALIYLSNMMKDRGGSVIDCQLETPHLKSMGAKYIDYDEYLKLIHEDF